MVEDDWNDFGLRLVLLRQGEFLEFRSVCDLRIDQNLPPSIPTILTDITDVCVLEEVVVDDLVERGHGGFEFGGSIGIGCVREFEGFEAAFF